MNRLKSILGKVIRIGSIVFLVIVAGILIYFGYHAKDIFGEHIVILSIGITGMLLAISGIIRIVRIRKVKQYPRVHTVITDETIINDTDNDYEMEVFKSDEGPGYSQKADR